MVSHDSPVRPPSGSMTPVVQKKLKKVTPVRKSPRKQINVDDELVLDDLLKVAFG